MSNTSSKAPTDIPTHCIVDPCAAVTDYIKAQVPADQPQPVFWSKALIHGENAVAAKFIKKGFAFNREMDLAWALGFPEMRFIVEGYPASNTREAIAKAFDPEDALHKTGRAKWRNVIGTSTIVQPQRGAVAVYTEGVGLGNPFLKDDNAFLAQTEFTKPTQQELITLFRKRAVQTPNPDRVELFLEALIGPDTVAEALANLVLEPVVDSLFGPWSVAEGAIDALLPIARRLLPAHHLDLCKRLAGQYAALVAQGVPSDSSERAREYRDAVGSLKRFLALNEVFFGETKYGPETHIGVHTSHWDESRPDVTLSLAQAETKGPQIPSIRMLFAGDEAIFEVESRWQQTYDVRDKRAAYLNAATTIARLELLPGVLSLLTVKDAKPHVTAWLCARAEWLKPKLSELAASSLPESKLAAQALKLL